MRSLRFENEDEDEVVNGPRESRESWLRECCVSMSHCQVCVSV
jgi:hypothetical protein